MHPVIFEFGPFKVYSYGLMVAAAFITAAFLASQEAARQKVPAEKIFNLSIYLVAAGVLGARILYVLQNLEFYLIYPSEILMLHKGGLSFYGGFILAVICGIIFLKRQEMPVSATLDIIAPYLALAQAIGRIGCFLNGCCYGKPTNLPFAVYFPGETIARHPVQIYSSLILLFIFVILRLFQAKRHKGVFSGQVFLLYCLSYGSARFFMEYLRGDNLHIFAGFTLHQLISAAVFIISLLIWRKRCKNSLLRSQSKIKA